MKTRIFSLLIVASLFVAQFPAAIAYGQGTQASGHDWSAVQAIGVDERLIVKQKDGKTIEGKMIEASDSNLTLSRNSKVVNISRDSIRQIEHSKGKAAKAKWAAIGTGIGAAAGLGIGATKYSANRDDSEIWMGVGMVFGAGAGALTGLLIGASQRKREVIYQAP
jgi:hypothetical protein